jgi:TonB family protein
MPKYLEAARRNRLEGYVEMFVEYRADGSVGDIQVTKKLGAGLDEEAVRAARQVIFLPAVKDGAFVTSRSETKIGFDLPGGKRLDAPSTKD